MGTVFSKAPCRYMGADGLAKARLQVIDCEADEVTEQDLTQVS